MKARISSSTSFSSVSFCIILVILFLTFMLMISCSENPAIAEPQSKQYFDSSLLSFGDYIHSSIPSFGLDNNPINAQQKRGLIYWYSKTDSEVKVYDILGNDVNVNPQQAQVTTLNVFFDPSRKGIYNNGELSPDLKTNWGGIFRALPDSIIKKFDNTNLVIKLWIKIYDAPEDATLNIDIGKISEVILPNGKFDTEDKNSNGLLEEGEDTGIDGIFDLEEPNYNDNDPNNDDFSYSSGIYENINGLENNKLLTESRRTIDSEDLNRNFALDQSNDYFSYQIPLDESRLVTAKIVEYGNNGWIQVKIPIDLPDMIVGSPDKNQIETIRLWLTNAERAVHIRIAQIKFEEI